MTENQSKKLIVGITGASGIPYGVEVLRQVASLGLEVHLILSSAAVRTLKAETDVSIKDVEALASVVHSNKDIGASIASGSFQTLGMIVAPCSIKTMSEIRSGITGSLISRAADVILKERRRLVLMVRETPFHTGHLRSMTALSEMGAVIVPPVPAFYTRPQTIEDIVSQSVARTLELFGIEGLPVQRWGDPDIS